MSLTLIKDDIYQLNEEVLDFENVKDYNGILIHFPFREICFKSFNFFWYLPNVSIQDLNIESLIEIIKKKEYSTGNYYIEGVKLRSDGPYKLNIIDLKNLNFKIKKTINKNKLSVLYLELFL